mgnify:CR=1 FL=1
MYFIYIAPDFCSLCNDPDMHTIRLCARILTLAGILMLFSSCPRKAVVEPYSFFVAGHTYGVKEKPIPGLHMPFVADFETLNNYPDLHFGVLTGDIVYYSRDTSWSNVDRQLQKLNVPVYFTTGNHDEGHKQVYQERYGITYYSFEQGTDLCIVLNPGLGGWNIWNEQMNFLKAQMEKVPHYKHVFLFFHHLVWWDDDNEYSNYRPNSLDGRAPTVNFLSEVLPMLQACGRPVYCFAGDVGAAGHPTVFFADKRDNVYLIASGMGNQRKDNYLIVDVYPETGVEIKIRWLQGQDAGPSFPADEELPFGVRLFP